MARRSEATLFRFAIICLFLVLSTAILSISFILGTDTPQGGFLLNLGTEVGGIVLTVAIVDWLFERRATKRSHRHRTLASLANQSRLALNARDTIYQWQLDDWANLCAELRERLPRRRSAFKADESEAVSAELAQSEKVLQLARQIADHRKTARGWRDLLESAIDRRHDELEDIPKLLESFVAGADPQPDADFVRTELVRILPVLSAPAATSIAAELGGESPDFRTIAGILDREKDIRLYDYIYFTRFERATGREWRSGSYESATNGGLSKVQDKALAELKEANTPALFVQFGATYMATEHAAIATRTLYEIEVAKLLELTNKAERNILDETPLD